MDFTDLNGVLVWLVGAGITVWTINVSDFFRNYEGEWFVALSDFWRQVVVVGAMASLPTVAYVILAVVPPDVIDALQPHYAFLATLFTAIVAARGFFEATKHRASAIAIAEVDQGGVG